MIKIIKSFLLGSLIIASLYQVITLWSDDVSDRNFFYSFIQKATDIISYPGDSQKKEYLIRPSQLGIFLGASDKDFTEVRSTQGNYEDIYNKSLKVLLAIMSEGRLMDKYKDDEVLWEDRGLVFTLPISLSRADLAQDLNINQNRLEDLTSTTTVGIIPANDKNNLAKAYFIDDKTGSIYVYALNQKDIQADNDLLNGYIGQMEGKGTPAYLSTYKENSEFFNKNVLLPLSTEKVIYDDGLNFVNPYVDGGELNKSGLDLFVNHFFDNPAVVWSVPSGKGITYSDDSAVVKYSKTGVLEYLSLGGTDDINEGLSHAFNVAQKFISQDILLTRSMYNLVSYEKSMESYTFYYSYAYNDLPIYLEQEEYPMEITVENGKVTDYKRLVITWAANGATRDNSNIRFEDALDTFLEDHNVKNGELEDMSLCYVEEAGKVQLKWVIRYQGENYFIDL